MRGQSAATEFTPSKRKMPRLRKAGAASVTLKGLRSREA
jgi:hypothetical protein